MKFWRTEKSCHIYANLLVVNLHVVAHGMKTSYKIALTCGLLPMVLGTAVFAVWLATDIAELEIAGIFIIQGGLILFAIGFISLLVFINSAMKDSEPFMGRSALCAVVLLLNFPLCVGYLLIAFAMENANVVTVVNESAKPVTDLVLSDPSGRKYPIAPILPGASRTACYAFSGEGSVQYAFTNDGTPQQGQLIGYITSGLGSHGTLRLSKDDEAAATEDTNRVSATDFFKFCA